MEVLGRRLCHSRVTLTREKEGAAGYAYSFHSSSSWMRVRERVRVRQLLQPQPPKKILAAHTAKRRSIHIQSLSPPLCSLSAAPEEVNEDTADSAIQSGASEPSKSMMIVHVRFVLQKECMFGQRFILVGDDPILGQWDPSKGIPLDWSDGHVWSTQLDLPIAIGESIEFKFVLQDLSEDVYWQPGPNRVLSIDAETTIANANLDTIIVLEKWEDADKQQILSSDDALALPQTNLMEEPISIDCNKGNAAFVDSNGRTGETPESMKEEERSFEIVLKEREDGKLRSNGDALLVPGLDLSAVPETASLPSTLPPNEALLEDSDDSRREVSTEEGPEKSNTILPDQEATMISDTLAFNDDDFKEEKEEEKGGEVCEEKQEATTAGILQNDVLWGRRSLQQLLFALGFNSNHSS